MRSGRRILVAVERPNGVALAGAKDKANVWRVAGQNQSRCVHLWSQTSHRTEPERYKAAYAKGIAALRRA